MQHRFLHSSGVSEFGSGMGNLMSCVLICGAVEVVHVVHSDGHVERLIRPLDSSKDPHNSVMKKRLGDRSSSSGTNSSPCSPSSSPSQADLMSCFANLSKTPLDSSDALSAGRSYLLLPIRNAAAAGAESAPVFKYKRFSSFQFYKSALLSPASILKSSHSHHPKSLFPPSSNARTAPSGASKLRPSPASSSSSSSRKTHNPTVAPLHHNPHHDDRKQLLLKDSSSSIHHHHQHHQQQQQQQPFKVRQEGGVTKLVVSKKYLAQLLSESNMKKSSTAAAAAAGSKQQDHHHNTVHHQNGLALPSPATITTTTTPTSGNGNAGGNGGASPSSVPRTVSASPSASAPARIGRPGVWRPALESISEAAHHAAAAAAVAATSTIAR